MKLLTALCLGGAYAIVAPPVFAGDKVEYAPAATWVKPIGLPKPSSKSVAAVEILLSDSQISMKPGTVETYAELALYIRNPQGLSAGNIQFPWRPETDRLIVHKVQLRRGEQVIDLLANGQTFTVIRRETNLESAVLDGVLTATLQPEGLQVGDIVNYAVTIVQSDPVLKGHVEQAGALWNGFPISKAHMRVQWLGALPVRVRQSASLPPIKPIDQDGLKVVDLALDDVQPLNLPKGAPLRYQIGRVAEFSDFASWADMAALLAPLYEKASALPPGGKLAAEAARIKAKSNDPIARAEAALALVQDRIRYVALAMGQGGLVPADAETSWERRFADCKGKTAMLLGLLHALGIAADPVVVNVGFGDGIDRRLPMVGLFNHVIVRATIAGKTYWLDGTHTGDTKLSQIEVPNLRWGLPLVKEAALVPIIPPAYDEPREWTDIRIDARQGLTVPAPIKAETVVTGEEAVASNVMFSNMTADVRDRSMRDFWRGQFESIDIKTVGVSFDPVKREQRFTVEGTTTMDWSDGRYEADHMRIGYKADFLREEGPDRDAPFAVGFPYHERTVETILLPPGFSEANNIRKAPLDETIAGIAYHRASTLTGDTFRIERTMRATAPEFPASDAPAAQKRLRELADVGLWLYRPAGYRETPQELAAKASKPATEKAATATDTASIATRMSRAKMLVSAEKCGEAIVEYDAVLAAEPKNVMALLGRAGCQPDKTDGVADARRAVELAPELPYAHATLGSIALDGGDWATAASELTIALKAVPGQSAWLLKRGRANLSLKRYDEALADAGVAIAAKPDFTDAYVLRANVYLARKQTEQGLAEATAMEKLDGDVMYANVMAGKFYAAFGKQAEAMRVFDRAIAQGQRSFVYLNRGDIRPDADVKGKLADYETALRLDPKSIEARNRLIGIQYQQGNYAAVVDYQTQLIALVPDNPLPMAARGLARMKKGDTEQGHADLSAAHALAKTPSDLNSLCWEKGMVGLDLEAGLAECDAALARKPDWPAYLDSRGLILMRLGRFDEAVAAYGKALAKEPEMASSLYGRALVFARKGDKAKSAADAAAAIRIEPQVADHYRDMGLTL